MEFLVLQFSLVRRYVVPHSSLLHKSEHYCITVANFGHLANSSSRCLTPPFSHVPFLAPPLHCVSSMAILPAFGKENK